MTEASSAPTPSIPETTSESSSPTTTTALSPTPPTETASPASKRPNAGQSLRKKGKTWVALAEFEEAVGGRERLAETIALAPGTARQRKILALLADPARACDSLARICADASVLANEVLLLFREGNFARAYAQAHQVIADRLPAVVEDVAEKAEDQVVPCTCRLTAEGFTGEVDPKCTICAGKGVRFQKSSLQHQQLLLEAADMLKRGTGVNVQVQQNVGVAVDGGFFERLIRATDDSALDLGVIEGEIIKNEGEK